MDGTDWVLESLGSRDSGSETASGPGLALVAGPAVGWLTMQWLWVVEGRVVPWSQAAKTAAHQAAVSWHWAVSSSCRSCASHQAAGWSFLLAGRAICQPRPGSAGRRGSQSPSSHLPPVTPPGTWSDNHIWSISDPQPLGEIIRNTGCGGKQREPACLVSIDQPLANNRSYSDLTASSCWIHGHKAFCYKAKHQSRNIPPRYSADVIFIKVLKPCLLSREARVESEAQTAGQDLTIA